MPGLPSLPQFVTAMAHLGIALLAVCALAGVSNAADRPNGDRGAPPPGITIEPSPQKPGMADDDEDEDAPEEPGGPGCPVNQRPLELLV